MVKIDYEIEPKLEDGNHDDIDVLNLIEDMAKIRSAVDEVFADLDDLPESGELFLWKSYKNECRDHILFSFGYRYDDECRPTTCIITVKDIGLWIKSGKFSNGCDCNTFLEMHEGEFAYCAY